MGFRDFISSVGDFASEVWKWLYSWWQTFKPQVLASARQSEKGISFRFPKAAIVSEAYRFEKGLKIAQQIDPTNAWKTQQTQQFRKSINSNLKNVAGFLGYLFEIEVVSYLMSQGLQLDGMTNEELHANRNVHLQKIRKYLSQFPFDQMVKYVQTHAAELGAGIIQKSHAVLKCKPSMVHYVPQLNVEDDITVSCGENHTNWSLKYVSEPLVKVRDMSIDYAYDVMGGRTKDISDINAEIEANPKQAFDIVLDKFWNLLESNGWTDDPDNFARLLAFLLRGNEKSNFAIKNYTMNTGFVGMSPAIEKDFRTVGTSLRSKPGATVSMVRTTDYIKFQYKVAGGAGTYILLRIGNVSGGRGGLTIRFYANNLTSG